MRVGIIGSRNLMVTNLEKYLPAGTTEIVSGGARGIDRCARHFAQANGIKLTEFLPAYHQYGKGAPLRRNLDIIAYSDLVLAFWDGKSRGTKFVIDNCKKQGKRCQVYVKKTAPPTAYGKQEE